MAQSMNSPAEGTATTTAMPLASKTTLPIPPALQDAKLESFPIPPFHILVETPTIRFPPDTNVRSTAHCMRFDLVGTRYIVSLRCCTRGQHRPQCDQGSSLYALRSRWATIYRV